jgi:thiosulfate/3-mercaptopyruvate sulfurtransferase
MNLTLGIILSVVLAFPGIALHAAELRSVIDTAQVKAAQQRGAIFWDVRDEEDYRAGHIPGAVSIGDAQRVLRDENNEDYLPVEEIAETLGGAGIDLAKEIVVYGAKAHTAPYFALVTLQYFGAKNVFVYHGGIDDWRASNGQLDKDSAQRQPLTLKLAPNPNVVIGTKDVLARLNNKDVQILDARGPREFSGEDMRALRGGHIPGALNIPYEQNWSDPDTYRKLARKQVSNKDGLNLKSAEQLKALYAKLDPNKEIIVYCQSGVRSAVSASILMEIGFKNVKVYDSSWLGYGNAFEAPVESLKFFNVGLMNAKLNAMQMRIDELEEQIEKMRQKAPAQ